MLASVLPGLREIRAPLAAGFVWLALVWVCFAAYVPNADEATGLLQRVYNLSAYAGVPSTLAVVTFVAYLVGATWEVTAVGVKDRVRRALVRRFGEESWVARSTAIFFEGGYSPDTFVSKDTRVRLDAYLDEKAARASMDEKERAHRAAYLLQTLKIAPSIDSDDLKRSSNYYSRLLLLDEIDGIARTLQLKNEALFSEYDRLRAEGRFRLRLTTPMSLLIIAASYQTSLLGVGLVVMPILLWSAGKANIRAANDLLMRHIIDGKAESLWMDRLFTASDIPA